jgi:hypothetical protein
MKPKSVLAQLLLPVLLIFCTAPAQAEGGVGIGITIGGNRGSSLQIFVGQNQDPGCGWGWGLSTPYGVNGRPTWGGAGYGLCPPRPYPQPIPQDVETDMKVPVYGWTTDPQTGDICYSRTGWRIEKVKVRRYIYP